MSGIFPIRATGIFGYSRVSDIKEKEMSHSYGGLTEGIYKVVNGEKIKVNPLEDLKKDSDWQCAFWEAFYHNYQWGNSDDHPINSVEEILAYSDGENEGPDWIGVFYMGEPYLKYAIVAAGCDYTGWDCQAGGAVEFYEDVNHAVSKFALTNDMRERLGDQLRQKEKEGRIKLDWDLVEDKV
jgi:hypothetical protein